MHIVYDYQIFSFQPYGGVSRYYCELASRIGKEPGIQAEIIAPLHVNHYLTELHDIQVFGLFVPKLPYSVSAMKCANTMLSAPILAAKRPDIVHETFYCSWRTAPHSARLVITIHDMIHEKLGHLLPRPPVLSKHKKAAVERADHIICISHHTKKDLQEILAVPEDKISVIHHGISLAARHDPPAPPVERPYLLYVGDREWNKNFKNLLHAYAGSKRLREDFLLLCFGGGPFKRDDMELMAKLHLGACQIQHTGGDDALLQSHYAHAAAFISPSLYEGFGMPILEAMAARCPVICSRSSVYPEVAGNAACFFDPTIPESISQAIEEVVYSGAYREELVQRGTERLRHFSWSSCTEKTMSVYRNLMG